MRIGIWQGETPKGGIAAVLTRIEQALTIAKDDGVNMLVFPECFLTGYYMDAATVPKVAAEISESVLVRLQSICDATQVAFVLGSYRPVSDGIVNTAFVFRRGAPTPVTYDKRALYGSWEKSVFQAGRSPLLFDHMGVTFAVLICFDVEFPELVREAARLGAQAVLVPTALMAPDHWVTDFMVPSRALENNVTLAYANRIGTEGHLTFIGKSQLCDGDATRRVIAPETYNGLIAFDHQKNPNATDYLDELDEMITLRLEDSVVHSRYTTLLC